MFDMIMEMLPLVAGSVPVNVLSVVGGVSLLGTVFSKPKSQYKSKLGLIFQVMLKYMGGNFGKARNE